MLAGVFRQLVQVHEPTLNENRVLTKDGRDLLVEWHGRPIFDEKGNFDFFLGLGIDITQRKQAAAERERLIADLENRTAELERFIYTVSHDLKSPLITIQEFLGLLREDIAAGDAEQIDTDIRFMTTAAKRMQKMLAELLELSRIGRLDNPVQKIALEDLAREATELVAGQIHERGVQIDIQPGLPAVYGDRPRLLEVMQNLVENAVKFMGKNLQPQIKIGVRHDDDKSVYFVQDNGIGIESRYHKKIFELFDKLDNNSEGTGIGLALVKTYCDEEGIGIHINSEKGEGTCVSLNISKIHV